MKKVIILLVMLFVLVAVLCSCECKHEECSAATCTSASTCLKCGVEVAPALGHNNGEWVTDKEPTCTVDGSKHQSCTVCGDTVKTETIAMLGHKNGEWVTDKEPTCTDNGSKHQSCAVCGDTVKTETLTMLGHQKGGWVTEKEPTCVADGLKRQSCTVCNETLATETLSMLGHQKGEWVTEKEPTCVADGLKRQSCTVCNETLATETLSMLGHKAGEWIIDKTPTCVADGSQHKSCTVCGETLVTEAIAMYGHMAGSWITDKEPTCTTEGSKRQICSSCGATVKTETIAATGEHNYRGEVTTEATCTSDGVNTFTCSMCNHSYTEIIVAGHKWADATCTAPKTCSGCNATEGAALGHAYVDATSTTPKTCTRCGHTVGGPVTWYESNTYKVGVDIPAGEYYIQSTSTSGTMCYFAISSDSAGKSILENENFHGHHYVTLEDGQYFTLSRGKCTSVDNITLEVDMNNISVGMYRVGIDIPAGEYKLTKTSGTYGYLAVYDNSTASRKIRTNDNFTNNQYITVYEGEYLYLSRCYGVLVKEIETTPKDETLWSFAEAKDLNTIANNATGNAQKAWEYAIDAMTASPAYKVLYNQYAVKYAGIAKEYLASMKAIADSNAELNLTNTNGKYSTLQEKIDYAYRLCDEIINLKIDSSNYTLYEDKILAITQELATECLGIQKLSVDLLEAFS